MNTILNKFQGVGVALITPFDKNRKIDSEALRRLIYNIEDGGVDYLLALGTTAETATMTKAEKNEVVSLVKQYNKKSLPIMLGMGGNCTSALVEEIKSTDFSGIDAILSVTPYYNKPSQRGLFEHFSAIAEASPVPVFLYNVPGRTGVNLKPETVIELAKKYRGKIVGIKEASGIVSQSEEIVKALGNEDFCVLSGDDNKTPELMAVGARGVISVSVNAFPQKVKTMVDAIMHGDKSTANRVYNQLYETTELLFKEGNPTGIKAALSILGVIDNNLRLPLVPASESLSEEIRNQIQKDNLC